MEIGHGIISGRSLPTADSSKAIVSYWRKDVHFVLVNRLGSLHRNSVVKRTDGLDMTIVVDWDVKPQIKQTYKRHCTGLRAISHLCYMIFKLLCILPIKNWNSILVFLWRYEWNNRRAHIWWAYTKMCVSIIPFIPSWNDQNQHSILVFNFLIIIFS